MGQPVCKLLKNKDEIKAYLGNISDYSFRKYIRMGMPALFIDANWMAHIDNIDEFFRKHTNKTFKDLIDQIEPDGKNSCQTLPKKTEKNGGGRTL